MSDKLTLEQKLTRLQEIQKSLESGSVNLTDSIALFEEANNLKQEIETELSVIKNKIIEIEAKNTSKEEVTEF